MSNLQLKLCHMKMFQGQTKQVVFQLGQLLLCSLLGSTERKSPQTRTSAAQAKDGDPFGVEWASKSCFSLREDSQPCCQPSTIFTSSCSMAFTCFYMLLHAFTCFYMLLLPFVSFCHSPAIPNTICTCSLIHLRHHAWRCHIVSVQACCNRTR